MVEQENVVLRAFLRWNLLPEMEIKATPQQTIT